MISNKPETGNGTHAYCIIGMKLQRHESGLPSELRGERAGQFSRQTVNKQAAQQTCTHAATPVLVHVLYSLAQFPPYTCLRQ
jgi:hypothetical protein